MKTKLQKLKDHNMGVMISTHPDVSFCKSFLNQNLDGINGFALDNGAFSAYRNKTPWSEYAFLWHLNQCIFKKVKLDFVVVPDIVAGGADSLLFSMRWADRLVGCTKALVVQDGMTPTDVKGFLMRFRYIFVGGTPEWKWRTLESWIKLTHDYGMKIHVGQVGTVQRIQLCEQLGVDSVDSTNFVRNDSFETIETYKRQQTIF